MRPPVAGAWLLGIAALQLAHAADRPLWVLDAQALADFSPAVPTSGPLGPRNAKPLS